MRCNNGNGWLKLHRKVLENPYAMKNRDYFSIWIYLLLNVAYEPTETLFNNEKITLQPGQGVFTITEISTKLGVSRRGTQVVLNRYRDEGMICTEVKRWNTLISIVGWNEYQSCDTEVERKRNGDDTEVESLHIYKELKKGRSKENKADFSSVYEDAPVELHEAMKAFEEMRLSMRGKPFTENAFRLIMNKVNKLSGGDIGKSIEILNQSVMNSWKGVFELKEEKKPVNDVSIWDC